MIVEFSWEMTVSQMTEHLHSFSFHGEIRKVRRVVLACLASVPLVIHLTVVLCPVEHIHPLSAKARHRWEINDLAPCCQRDPRFQMFESIKTSPVVFLSPLSLLGNF